MFFVGSATLKNIRNGWWMRECVIVERGCSETPVAFVCDPVQPVHQASAEQRRIDKHRPLRDVLCLFSAPTFNESSHTCAYFGHHISHLGGSVHPLFNQNVSGTAGRHLHGKDSDAGMWYSWTIISIVELTFRIHLPKSKWADSESASQWKEGQVCS